MSNNPYIKPRSTSIQGSHEFRSSDFRRPSNDSENDNQKPSRSNNEGNLTSPTSTSTKKPGQTVIKTLESKTKPELVSIAKKMMSEINIKNRIIHDIKSNEKWLSVELAMFEGKPKKSLADSDLKKALQSTKIPEPDKKIISTLLNLKLDLEKSKQKIEEQESSLVALERKRVAAVEEAAYLSSILYKKDIKNVQTARIKELEAQLKDNLNEFTELQAKVSQWAKTSKKNQEGRIVAEAQQKVLEEEAINLQKRLKQAVQAGRRQSAAKTLGNTGQTKQALNEDVQYHINELEENLVDATNAYEDLKADFEAIQANLKRETTEKEDLMRKCETLQIKNQSLENQLQSQVEFKSLTRPPIALKNEPSANSDSNTKRLHHDYQVLEQKYQEVNFENLILRDDNENLRKQMDEAKEATKKMQEVFQEQEETMHTIGALRLENQKLKQLSAKAESRLNSKQLAVEMLQKHVEMAQTKLGPLQDAADDLDDIKDELEKEKIANQELLAKMREYSDENQMYQEKIVALMQNRTRKNNRTSLYYNEEIETLQEELQSYKEENEMLLIQLEESQQDVDMLEKRLNAKDGLGEMFTVSTKSKDTSANREEEDVGSKELELATTKLAEQMILINRTEVELASQQETIELLQTEKAKLNQQLISLQKVKSDHDSLLQKYEQLRQSSGNSDQSQEIIQTLMHEKRVLQQEFDKVQEQKIKLESELDEFDELQDRLMAEKATNDALRRMLDEQQAR